MIVHNQIMLTLASGFVTSRKQLCIEAESLVEENTCGHGSAAFSQRMLHVLVAYCYRHLHI